MKHISYSIFIIIFFLTIQFSLITYPREFFIILGILCAIGWIGIISNKKSSKGGQKIEQMGDKKICTEESSEIRGTSNTHNNERDFLETYHKDGTCIDSWDPDPSNTILPAKEGGSMKYTNTGFFEERKIKNELGLTRFYIPDGLNDTLNTSEFEDLINKFDLKVYFGESVSDHTHEFTVLSFGEYPTDEILGFPENVPQAIKLLKRQPKLYNESWDSYNDRRSEAYQLICSTTLDLLRAIESISMISYEVFTNDSSKPKVLELLHEFGPKLDYHSKPGKKQIECNSFFESYENSKQTMSFPCHLEHKSNCIIIDDILGWGGGLTHINNNVGEKPNLFIYFAHDKSR